MDEIIGKTEKDIYKNAPKNKLVLGKFTFTHPYFKKSSCVDLNDVRGIKLCKYEFKRGTPQLDIEISTQSFKISVKCESVISKPHEGVIKCESVLCNDLPRGMFDSLLPTCFMWVAKSIAHGSLHIEIVTTTEYMPIQVDNDVKMWLTGENYSAIQYVQMQEMKNFYAKDFFKELKSFQNSICNYDKIKVENVQHEDLISSLRPYQCRAVQWMLGRECGNFQVHDTDWLSHEVTTCCGKKLYYYPYSKMLLDKRVPSYGFPETFPAGILADEMGLGKTLVVIALILNHPRGIYSDLGKDVNELKSVEISLKREPQDDVASCSGIPPKKQKCDLSSGKDLTKNKSKKNSSNNYELICVKSKTKNDVRCVCGVMSESVEGCVQCPGCLLFQHKICVGYNKKFAYFCPSCWPNQELLKSNGTLIVAPTSIYNQWREEIEKHVNDSAWERGVYMFSSVDRAFIQPSVLASYDIVITTYTSLPNELPHTIQKRVREFRHKRQYLRKCSPLALIEWWRVCLDEAQLVEAGSPNYVQISEMAKLIPAVNRWSVTGTPIQKSVDDLYYLFNWMGIKPFEDRLFWYNYLYKPYLHKNPEPLFSVLSQVFWRNSKEEVDGELSIPEQTTEYHILKFTAIEQTFYMEQHADVMTKFLTKLEDLGFDLNHTLDSLDRHTLDMVLTPLLSLRQACSHHLAVNGQFEYMMERKKGMKNKLKKTMRLDALLNSLKDRRKTECEDILKNYFRDLNSLGDIYSSLQDWPNAVKNYEAVLSLDKEYHEKDIRIDVLQKIHAINQLFKVMEKYPYEVPEFLKDEEFKTQAIILEMEFLKNPMDEYDKQKKEVGKFMKNFLLVSFNKYFQDGLDAWWLVIIKEIMTKDLFDEFVEEMNKEFEDVLDFLKKIITKKDMKAAIRKWLKRVKEYREDSVISLGKLLKTEPDKLAKKAFNCHLRKSKDVPAPKKKCKFCRFQSNVICYERSLFARDDHLGEDILKPQNEEDLLKFILNFGKSKKFKLGHCLRDGENFFELLKIMKEEVQEFILVKNKADLLIRAKDEISSSKLFFEELNKENVDFEEIQIKKNKFEDDVKVKESEMRKKYGSYLYLKTLEEENDESRDCPICLAELENEWCVLQCGHSYCPECLKSLIGIPVKDFVKCSICRELTKGCDVGLVSLNEGNYKNDPYVFGDHSTKIKAIIKTINDLKSSDPSVKIIIFSTWEIVLKILKNALDENGISYRDMIKNKKWKEKKLEMEKYFEDQLREFKNPFGNVTALLLPLHLGSKGLNLIEATHVFLIEPILNPAEELQAIGRVHRMGQTKKTVVHRFLIKGTIEEKIHSAVVSKAKEKWDRKEVTIGDLKNLIAIDSK